MTSTEKELAAYRNFFGSDFMTVCGECETYHPKQYVCPNCGHDESLPDDDDRR